MTLETETCRRRAGMRVALHVSIGTRLLFALVIAATIADPAREQEQPATVPPGEVARPDRAVTLTYVNRTDRGTSRTGDGVAPYRLARSSDSATSKARSCRPIVASLDDYCVKYTLLVTLAERVPPASAMPAVRSIGS